MDRRLIEENEDVVLADAGPHWVLACLDGEMTGFGLTFLSLSSRNICLYSLDGRIPAFLERSSHPYMQVRPKGFFS